MARTTPTPSETTSLFHTIEHDFPSSSLGPNKWYILLLAALTAGGHPGKAADLYTYLISSRPEFEKSEQRQNLMKRLRETLVKLVPIVGVVKPLEAVFCIAEIERPEDRDGSFSRENWSSGPLNSQRGSAWLAQIYQHNHAATESVLSHHKDFEWISREITYGLFLSDHTILGPVETEIVVLAGIAMQNLPRETGWHLRGMRRIGVAIEDVELVQRCVERVAEYCGLVLDRIPRVADVEHEVAF
ncbi:uncharacterized protein SEPMUDRAFT_136741 [Sphaerulina musiva SO2202]|uniref:Carboxymuconolactone decarboxylase-like domain-containing protein n=1 Tax=Sphaerulina musiva (strain SO2202) TaxID=692275 RepID=M3ASY1_SPHMS|nr:uncharacterized protein SEPMUDRAFT_136741 [Sphaerulina musiva SO2202]EMF08619.1 hypothetical protein SEPMUDRAFT_136741 [Sphaerulina musiva SO2202]